MPRGLRGIPTRSHVIVVGYNMVTLVFGQNHFLYHWISYRLPNQVVLTLSLPIFWLPVSGFWGVKIWKQAIPLTFVNTATIIANGTEGVLSTLVANGTGTVSTIVANGSERVNVSMIEYINGIRASVIDCGRVREIPSLWAEYSKILNWNIVYRKLSCCWDSWRYDKISDTGR